MRKTYPWDWLDALPGGEQDLLISWGEVDVGHDGLLMTTGCGRYGMTGSMSQMRRLPLLLKGAVDVAQGVGRWLGWKGLGISRSSGFCTLLAEAELYFHVIVGA